MNRETLPNLAGIKSFRGSRDPVRPLPLNFPRTNARLDENFKGYLDFFINAFAHAGVEAEGLLRFAGGLAMDKIPRGVCGSLRTQHDEHGKHQFWWLAIEGYGHVEMDARLEDGEVNAFYKRIMKDGSYCDSRYACSASGSTPLPVVFDSKAPVEESKPKKLIPMKKCPRRLSGVRGMLHIRES